MSADGEQWEASTRKLYGYGKGRAHPSVEHVKCPNCGAEPGRLCFNEPKKPKLGHHYSRADLFREKIAKGEQKLTPRLEPEQIARVQVLSCLSCGRLAVAINGVRVTSHKCAGSWKTQLDEECLVLPALGVMP